MPRELWLFTVPSLMPSSSAVSRTDRPSQCRSTTTLRCNQRQGLQRLEQRGPLLDGQGTTRHGVVPVQPGAFPTPRAAGCVDVGPNDDLTNIGLLAPWFDARPRDVRLDERGLQQVIGAVPVSADGRTQFDADGSGVPGRRRRMRRRGRVSCRSFAYRLAILLGPLRCL